MKTDVLLKKRAPAVNTKLTKREFFAALSMACRRAYTGSQLSTTDLARAAVADADALLEQLAK